MKKNNKALAKQLSQKIALKTGPHHPPKQVNFGDAFNAAQTYLQKGGRREAEFIFIQLAEQEREPLALGALLKLYLAAQWYPEGLAVADKYDVEKTRNPELLHLLALLLYRTGQAESAKRLLELNLKLKPNNAVYLCDLGLCYKSIGDKEAALGAFLQALTFDPQLAAAYLQAAQLIGPTERDTLLEKLLKARKKPGLIAGDGVLLDHAIGEIYKATGDVDREMEYLCRANEAMAIANPADLNHMRNEQQKLLSLFAAPVDFKVDTSDLAQPIIICSMPRSGSSLLELTLSRDPLVSATGESFSFMSAQRYVAAQKGLNPGLQDWSQSMLSSHAADLVERHQTVLKTYGVDTGYFTDKSIENYFLVGLILGLYPQAKIIRLERDPLDVCLSCYQQHFASGHEYIYSLEETAKQIRVYQRFMDHWCALYPDKVLPIRYEELVSDNAAALEKLRAFTGLALPENGKDDDGPVLTVSAWQVREPVNTRAVEKWRKYEKHLQGAKEALAESSK